jgi:hypothetical protein
MKKSLDCLRTYPTNADIQSMALEKEGVLVFENGDLYNKKTGE